MALYRSPLLAHVSQRFRTPYRVRRMLVEADRDRSTPSRTKYRAIAIDGNAFGSLCYRALQVGDGGSDLMWVVDPETGEGITGEQTELNKTLGSTRNSDLRPWRANTKLGTIDGNRGAVGSTIAGQTQRT